jgi:uncharacterized protein YbjT (DUF2867 family)
MRVAIAGGHGKIARLLTHRLSQRAIGVSALIRNPDHADDVRAAGAEPVLCDLEEAAEEAVADALDGVDAVVFAAGAGPGSGPERKWTVDHAGATKLAAAAQAKGIRRYLMVSSIGADPAREGDDTFSVYLRAKGQADADLQASGLDYTIVRPASLTDDPGTGRVNLADRVGGGSISREDVAAVLDAALAEPAAVGRTFEAAAGEVPVDEAVASLSGAR